MGSGGVPPVQPNSLNSVIEGFYIILEETNDFGLALKTTDSTHQFPGIPKCQMSSVILIQQAMFPLNAILSLVSGSLAATSPINLLSDKQPQTGWWLAPGIDIRLEQHSNK